jgi:iron complex outermembrane receptor protein
MDIESENTVLANAEYVASSLGRFSDALKLSMYHTRVEHNPSDKYRELVGNPGFPRHNEVVSTITGGKIVNTHSTSFADFAYGFDTYMRNWQGDMYNDATGAKVSDELIPDVDALNLGVYVKADKHFEKLSLGIGIRGERFQTEANEPLPNAVSKLGVSSNKQTDYLPSGYLSGKFYFSDEINMFAGIGQSVRTPTAVERYLQPPRGANFSGNPDLKPTQNREGDVGFEAAFLERVTFGAKGFYSFLKDYIYQEAAPKTWTNIDAKLYGGDAKVGVTIIPHLSTQAGIAFQKGEKVDQPKNNNNSNLAEIPPLKTRLALEYDHEKFFGTLEWIHSEDAEHVDVDAGEQKLDGWDVMNFRFGVNIWKATLSVGIDNIFNKNYAVANSYEWDVVAGSGANPPVVNEPGRSIYASGSIYF